MKGIKIFKQARNKKATQRMTLRGEKEIYAEEGCRNAGLNSWWKSTKNKRQLGTSNLYFFLHQMIISVNRADPRQYNAVVRRAEYEFQQTWFQAPALLVTIT